MRPLRTLWAGGASLRVLVCEFPYPFVFVFRSSTRLAARRKWPERGVYATWSSWVEVSSDPTWPASAGGGARVARATWNGNAKRRVRRTANTGQSHLVSPIHAPRTG